MSFILFAPVEKLGIRPKLADKDSSTMLVMKPESFEDYKDLIIYEYIKYANILEYITKHIVNLNYLCSF